MQHEFTRLEKLIHVITISPLNGLTDEQLQEWHTDILKEKELLQLTLRKNIKERAYETEVVHKYIQHHHNRLKDMLTATEQLPHELRQLLNHYLTDLMLYFELNHTPLNQADRDDLPKKAYVPFSVEVLALLCKLIWDEGFIRMKFKSHLIRALCKNMITLRAGNGNELSEKHLTDAMYHIKPSTINAAERILNKLKMRLNTIRSEQGKH